MFMVLKSLEQGLKAGEKREARIPPDMPSYGNPHP